MTNQQHLNWTHVLVFASLIVSGVIGSAVIVWAVTR